MEKTINHIRTQPELTLWSTRIVRYLRWENYWVATLPNHYDYLQGIGTTPQQAIEHLGHEIEKQLQQQNPLEFSMDEWDEKQKVIGVFHINWDKK